MKAQLIKALSIKQIIHQSHTNILKIKISNKLLSILLLMLILKTLINSQLIKILHSQYRKKNKLFKITINIKVWFLKILKGSQNIRAKIF